MEKEPIDRRKARVHGRIYKRWKKTLADVKENLPEKQFLFPAFCDIVRETSRKWPDKPEMQWENPRFSAGFYEIFIDIPPFGGV